MLLKKLSKQPKESTYILFFYRLIERLYVDITERSLWTYYEIYWYGKKSG